jgi:hypothetical protein
LDLAAPRGSIETCCGFFRFAKIRQDKNHNKTRITATHFARLKINSAALPSGPEAYDKVRYANLAVRYDETNK